MLLQKIYFAVGLSGCLLLCNNALADSVKSVDNLVTQWLKLEQQKNALAQEWQQTEPLLIQRLQLLSAEKKQLQSLLTEKQQSTNDTQVARARLLSEQTNLENSQNIISNQLTTLQQILAKLAPTLSPPVIKQWQKEDQTLTENADTTAQLANALAKLKTVVEFDQRISVMEDTITIDNKKPILVKQFYLGASRAWFMSADGSQTGVGGNQLGDWQWQLNSAVDGQQISDAIAMFEKQKTANFVTLPVELSAVTAEITQ